MVYTFPVFWVLFKSSSSKGSSSASRRKKKTGRIYRRTKKGDELFKKVSQS